MGISLSSAPLSRLPLLLLPHGQHTTGYTLLALMSCSRQDMVPFRRVASVLPKGELQLAGLQSSQWPLENGSGFQSKEDTR